MSTSSIRRTKERGGAGGKVAVAAAATSRPSKALTPISKNPAGGDQTLKRSTGKENPRPTSRIRAASSGPTQKPAIRPMPRIDKSTAAENPESRVRRSTSSVPRGRSSSPSEFNWVLSDLRKDRVSRVSLDRSTARIHSKKASFSDSSGNGTRVFKIRDSCKQLESKPEESVIMNPKINNLDKCSKEVNLSSDSMKSFLKSSIMETGEYIGTKVFEGVQAVDELTNGNADVDLKESGGKLLIRSNGTSEASKEKGVTINKYQSKIHEKLAFLEGKVKRIALDIKRTKEMLDMNNPDESKVILSDIQEKISGIEKAMVHVSGDDAMTGAAKRIQNDSLQMNVMGESQNKVAEPVEIPVDKTDNLLQIGMFDKNDKKVADPVKGTTNSLNTDQLEARFFPHHKLLRDRTSLKASSGSFLPREPIVVVSPKKSKQEENLSVPIEENSIALEFLALLSNEQSKVSTRGVDVGMEVCEVQEMDSGANSAVQGCLNMISSEGDFELTTSETLDEFGDQENGQAMVIEEEETEDSCMNQLNEIGRKVSTGGWFVSEGEAVLLAHDDGSCLFYDIANYEEKAEYKPPVGVSSNLWRDCWIIRAPGADGCSGRYVVAASAGNTMDSGFCSWDFYTKDVQAFYIENGSSNSRTALAPLPNNTVYKRNSLSTLMAPENRQWWYKPCGPLIASAASSQRVTRIYDIRDGEQIMKWESQKPVLAMDYSSPLQWRNRGKLVVAEAENISLWDVSSLSPLALLSISTLGRKITALHVNNTDAELGGGVRQRASSSEAEGKDGVFCTPDSINVIDFRNPSGIGLKIPKIGANVQSVFCRGDDIFLGCSSLRSAGKKQSNSQLQQYSMHKQKLVSNYALPVSSAHYHHTAITQVWGNSNFVMGVCGVGLFVFDASKDDGLQLFTNGNDNIPTVREVIGPDDLYSPSFDYLGSRVLLISRDRPALWRYLS
ncbi:hypothetical protein RJ639_005756 [Escallonia herrerae]|uniref:At4g14310 8-bladed propeller domain-containing protein n=1 Tax=Escallonia herrerae TaxID=1293975 RepID=A0AA88VUY3_9ASTE|nr:hypothetical protein RJ639_005756 [Escallonia herrerae]